MKRRPTGNDLILKAYFPYGNVGKESADTLVIQGQESKQGCWWGKDKKNSRPDPSFRLRNHKENPSGKEKKDWVRSRKIWFFLIIISRLSVYTSRSHRPCRYPARVFLTSRDRSVCSKCAADSTCVEFCPSMSGCRWYPWWHPSLLVLLTEPLFCLLKRAKNGPLLR